EPREQQSECAGAVYRAKLCAAAKIRGVRRAGAEHTVCGAGRVLQRVRTSVRKHPPLHGAGGFPPQFIAQLYCSVRRWAVARRRCETLRRCAALRFSCFLTSWCFLMPWKAEPTVWPVLAPMKAPPGPATTPPATAPATVGMPSDLSLLWCRPSRVSTCALARACALISCAVAV